MTRYLFIALFALTLVIGCSNKGEAKFIGTWVRDSREDYSLEISRNGNQYLVKEAMPVNGKMQTKSYPATFDGDMVQISNGVGITTMAIDKSTGHLVQGTRSWHRIK